MGTNSYASAQDTGEFQSHFNDSLSKARTGPVEERKCNDICCLVLFLLIFITFIAVGAYYISAIPDDIFSASAHNQQGGVTRHGIHFQSSAKGASSTQQSASFETDFVPVDMVPAIPVIVGMCVLSIVFAVILTCLIANFPKCVFYTMIVLTCIFLLMAGTVLLSQGQMMGLLLFALIILIVVVLCCKKEEIEQGIRILQNCGLFITQKPTVLLVPLFVGIFTLLFMVFWAYSFVGIVAALPDSSSSKSQSPTQPLLILLWSTLLIFFNIFLFYITVLLIGTAFALWYFDKDDNYFALGLRNLFRSHIGSLTFAAVIITLLRMLRDSVSKSRAHSSAGASSFAFAGQCCLCCLQLCLSTVEQLMETLNNNAILIMALTGEGFIDSAKTAFHAIISHFFIFAIVQGISEMLLFFAMLLISVLPSLIGYFILDTFTLPTEAQKQSFLMMGVFIIFVACLLIGSVFTTVISESLSAVLIYYCLNFRLKDTSNEIAFPSQFQSAALLFAQMNGAPPLNPNSYNAPHQPPFNNDPYNSNSFNAPQRPINPNSYNAPQGFQPNYNPSYPPRPY